MGQADNTKFIYMFFNPMRYAIGWGRSQSSCFRHSEHGRANFGWSSMTYQSVIIIIPLHLDIDWTLLNHNIYPPY